MRGKRFQVVRTVPLDFGPRYVELEWDRGVLPGTQTFYTAYGGGRGDDGDTSVVVFCTPE